MPLQRPPELIDIGANLTHDSFDPDREAVLERARNAGVARQIVTGSTLADSRAGIELANAYPGELYATVGVHPHHSHDWQAGTRGQLSALAQHPAVCAIGECGLDHFRNFSTPAEQAHAFDAQLDLAAEVGLPVFLHQRDAHDDFVAILGNHLPRLARAVAHCFTGVGEALDEYLEMGLYIGVTGWICDERRGAHLRELVPRIPADRLMIETDSPYLLPRDLKPKPKSRRNEPMHLAHILGVVAGCRGDDPAELARQTTANAEEFFDLPSLPSSAPRHNQESEIEH